MTDVALDRTMELLGTNASDRRFRDALAELFAGDGTIYLVSGYFTYHGYLAIRDDLVAFLERSPDNRLIAVVGPASDQFSARIAHDLWNLDDHDQVELYKKSRGLHAKLYLRDGPEPMCIVGSANITQVALSYNTELSVVFARDSIEHPDIAQFRSWAVETLAACEPLRRRDLVAPAQIGSSFLNWSNKARLLPRRYVALRLVPILVLVGFVAGVVCVL